jgi:serine/threonine protein kinase
LEKKDAEICDARQGIAYLRDQVTKLNGGTKPEMKDVGTMIDRVEFKEQELRYKMMKYLEQEWGLTNLRFINKGSYGRVFYCRTDLGEFALKVVLNDNKADDEVRFINQIVGKSPLCKKFVIELVDSNLRIFSPYTCIPIRYYPQNLKQAIYANKIKDIDHRSLIIKILYGIGAIHRQYYSHNDIKSANIMLDYDMTPKICDFGLADTQYTKAMKGTELYASPEMFNTNYQRRGGEVNCFKHDVWSVGVVIYEMLTQHLPFTTEELRVLRDQHIDNSVQFDHRCLNESDVKFLKKIFVLNSGRRPSIHDLVLDEYFEGRTLSISTCDIVTIDRKAFLEEGKSAQLRKDDPFIYAHKEVWLREDEHAKGRLEEDQHLRPTVYVKKEDPEWLQQAKIKHARFIEPDVIV